MNKFSFIICKYPLCFDNYKFTNIITENPVIQRNYADVSFKSCEFVESVILSSSKIKIDHILEMKNCIFYKAVKMNNKIFDSNAYFNNSTFKDYVDFHESTFNQTACFYGVTFAKVPNFSQTIFNGNLNLVNSKLNFGFNECKKAVENELDRRTIITSIPNTKFPVLYEVANDFRDSFRIFKNALIKDNNLLDASNYHKIELYFKEIELDSKKPKPFSKEWIDFWQLKLYRLTSNHHTDLLRIFSCLVILIGCFATILFFIKDYGNPKIWYGIFWATFGTISIFTALGKIRYLGFFTLLSLVPCAWLISYSPKYIFGVASLFGNNCNSIFLNFAFSIYTILFILLIFSLQKTARRNSIIPT